MLNCNMTHFPLKFSFNSFAVPIMPGNRRALLLEELPNPDHTRHPHLQHTLNDLNGSNQDNLNPKAWEWFSAIIVRKQLASSEKNNKGNRTHSLHSRGEDGDGEAKNQQPVD